MPADLAKYACDDCRSRKSRCSRETTGCIQCKSNGRQCVYSRSGIIRRRPKQPRRPIPPSSSGSEHFPSPNADNTTPPASELQSQIDYDINVTRDQLQQFALSDEAVAAGGTLVTLGAEYSSFWQGPSLQDMARELNMVDKKFLAFTEEETAIFIQIYEPVIQKGVPLFTPAPTDILRDVFLHPDRVLEKAYMVSAYGIALTAVALNKAFDKQVVTKLRWNLRLALDDANLLLEPTDLNIEALLLLALHIQELATPSLTWMFASTAARMLQFVGVYHRSLDEKTRDHRLLMFWTLNTMDKILAVIFGKPPSLHRSMSTNVPSIPIQKMLAFQPTGPVAIPVGNTAPFQSMFGAHSMDQFHRSSVLYSDIWSCIYEDSSNVSRIQTRLDEWHEQCTSTLEACIVAERPFLDEGSVESMRLGIRGLTFQYHYLKVLLLRSHQDLRDETVLASQLALEMLGQLLGEINEVYSYITWLILYCPFTPFFVLFGDLLSSRTSSSAQRSLAAMESMSGFLARMVPHHPQAGKLHPIAVTFVNYAKSAMDSPFNAAEQSNDQPSQSEAPPASKEARTIAPEVQTTTSTTLNQPNRASQSTTQPLADIFNDPSIQDLSMDPEFWLPSSRPFNGAETQDQAMAAAINDRTMDVDAYGFFADSNFDWLSWDPNPGMNFV